jgi:preprotein translocase subunit SecE
VRLPARGLKAAQRRRKKNQVAGGRAFFRPEVHGQMKNPLTFIQEVRQEVSKVTWPTWKEVWITTAMVIVMVALTSIFFLIADQIIGYTVSLILKTGARIPG